MILFLTPGRFHLARKQAKQSKAKQAYRSETCYSVYMQGIIEEVPRIGAYEAMSMELGAIYPETWVG